MRRRDFLLTASAAAAWPLSVRGQQAGLTQRVAAVMGWSDDNAVQRGWFETFSGELTKLAAADHRALQIERRWTNGDVKMAQNFARETVATKPDVIFATTTPVVAALHAQTKSIPIVFAVVADPVGAKFVESFSRPGGNITGFVHSESRLGGKWLALLKEAAPALTRIALMFNPDTAPGGGGFFMGAFEAAAKLLGVEPLSAPVRNADDIKAAVAALGARRSGLVLMDDAYMAVNYRTVIAAAAQANVPSIFVTASYAADGGLMGYSGVSPDLFVQSARYVDRILRGEKPADLPVQTPIHYQLTLNLKTANALGLEIPTSLLAAAAEVIE